MPGMPCAGVGRVRSKQPAPYDRGARDFVADAFGHCKFIGYSEAAVPLLMKAGVPASMDAGFVQLTGTDACEQFLKTCRQLRFWKREPTVKHV